MNATVLSPANTTAIILNFQGSKDTIGCLQALQRMPDKPSRTIIVDNGSGDGSVDSIKEWLGTENISFLCLDCDTDIPVFSESAAAYALVCLPDNNGYAAGNNAGISLALRDSACRAFWILNNDTEPQSGALKALCHCLNASPEKGMAGSTLAYYHNHDRVQCAGGFSFNSFLGTTKAVCGEFVLSLAMAMNTQEVNEKISYISGASLFIRREVIESIGLLAEEYFLYYEDTEFGLRARKRGYGLAWAPDSLVFHKEGGSSGASSGAGKSSMTRPPLIDYLSLRNRMYLMRSSFPYTLPFAVASYAGVIIRRIQRRQTHRIPLVLRALWHGLTKQTGRPQWSLDRAAPQKNILFITARADFGGGPEHLWQLLKHMPVRERLYVACPQDYPYFERFCRIIGTDKVCLVPHRKFTLESLWKLRSFCKQHTITVLHSHGKGAGVYSRFLTLLTGIPVVHTFHGVHMGEYGLLKKCLYRMYERCMSLITRKGIAVSQGEYRNIVHEGLMPKKKLFLIPNGVEVPESMPGDPAGPPYHVVCVTRFTYQKNSEFLVDIACCLQSMKRLSHFTFILIGDGPERNTVMQRARESGLDWAIKFTGATPDPHLFFRQSLCFLSTSRWEGMPLAVLEAMAHGLPAVVSDVVGNRDAVQQGATGILYPEGNAQAAAEALCHMADNHQIRKKYILQSREFIASHHNVQQMAVHTLNVLLDEK